MPRILSGTRSVSWMKRPSSPAIGNRAFALLTMLALLYPSSALSQQHADPDFQPAVTAPAYETGGGLIVAIDEGHKNWHTMSGRFGPFADLIANDGYVVRPLQGVLSLEALRGIDILVIANAAADTIGAASERLPTGSAFAPEEIRTLRDWVEDGGRLLLIADHMPSGGEARDLAAGFGVLFTNGYTYSGLGNGLPDIFGRANGLLLDHPITRGRTAEEAIDFVATFRGQAFQATSNVQPLMVYGSSAFTLLPADAAADFDEQTPRVPSPGWYHALTITHGAGRIAIFGEAAMFTAQVFGEARRKYGMNHPSAEQNAQFVLNVMHWPHRLSSGRGPVRTRVGR